VADPMGVSRIVLVGASLVLVVVSAGPAGAYELQFAPSGEAVRWHTDRVATEIAMTDGPAALAAGAAAEVAARALATWTGGGAPDFAAPEPGEQPALRIRFAMSASDPAIDPAALALTHLSFDSASGAILRAEIAVNGFGFRWAAGDECASGPDDYQYDLESTLAHEVGHAIGLLHSEDRAATMFTRPQPCARDRRDLADDDLAAIALLYGADSPLGDPDADSTAPAGCSAAGGGGRGGGAPLLVIAAGALAAGRRRSRRRAAATRCAG
jgi:hypothetical protein